ncbi:hypothetical protein CP03DC29_1003B, partial [Chlamydia psittaci 03DC29]
NLQFSINTQSTFLRCAL